MTDGQSSSSSVHAVAPVKPRRQPADVRRQQVLDAAERVLLSRGLRDTTMADVAETAGLGKGTLYLYFNSKDELLAGLRHRYIEQIEADLLAAVAKSASSTDQLAALVHGLLAAAARQADLQHLLFHEAGFSEVDAFAPVRAAFATVITGDAFDVPDPQLATDFVLGGVHAALVTAVHGTPAHRRRVADEVSRLVVRTLAPAGK
jgi:TetR/AcrR family transcriptional regulator, transcriptional repressor for nem operon